MTRRTLYQCVGLSPEKTVRKYMIRFSVMELECLQAYYRPKTTDDAYADYVKDLFESCHQVETCQYPILRDLAGCAENRSLFRLYFENNREVMIIHKEYAKLLLQLFDESVFHWQNMGSYAVCPKELYRILFAKY